MVSGIICIISVAFITLKLNKRVPLNFGVNLCFYFVAIVSRALFALIF